MANDTELTGSFIWSKTRKNLSKILKDYQLPQIVRVVDGFCGKNENTTISSEQILALHEIHSDRELLGTDNSGKQVIIPLTCPTQVLIFPSKCKYKPCKIENFQSIFPNIQYVRVKSLGPQSRNANNESTFTVGDIIQIQKIDRKKKSVLCQNTDTKGDMTLSYKSLATFTPLLDCRKYTLSEVVTNYGLPSRVCFVSTRSQADQNSNQCNSALTGLTEVVFHKEVTTEVKVIATTVEGGVGKLAHCIGLPTDLPIRCTVAERFTKNGRSYEDFVRTLHAGFDSKNLRLKIYNLTFSESMATVQRSQPNTSPSPVQSNAESTMTAEVHDEPAQNRPEVSATTDEDDYVDMSLFQKNIYEYIDCEKNKHSVVNQNNLDIYVSMDNSAHLTGNAIYVNAPSTPKVQDYLRNEGSQQQTPFNQPEINSKHSQYYEEVKHVWNSNSKQEFADHKNQLINLTEHK
ncbi:Hypothetical predicted protein [Paramuricea clavata]|uniref:Uncharacterized protein n=1 Tax=Paramuricea clavata TaxID=317549 RepID=A0A6S7G4Y9_PARCT|nr:Hypothetical predicted protein [Paramuricea clavata]